MFYVILNSEDFFLKDKAQGL